MKNPNRGQKMVRNLNRPTLIKDFECESVSFIKPENAVDGAFKSSQTKVISTKKNGSKKTK